MKVSGTLDTGSIPVGATYKKRNQLVINFLRFFGFKPFVWRRSSTDRISVS